MELIGKRLKLSQTLAHIHIYIAMGFIQTKIPWKIAMELTQPILKKTWMCTYYYKQSRIKIKMERDYIVTSIVNISY